MFKCIFVLLLFSTSFLVAKEPPLDPDKLEKIDAFINEAKEKFNIPGIAVGVVVNGEVVLSKGYGFRDRVKKLPVTESTLFPIASCSKAFTTFALGQMVDEGLVNWDDPVIKHIPEFSLKDIHATHHLTIRDLVTHQSGLPRHDKVWYGSSFSREELLNRLPYLDYASDLRQKFQYNNIMYAIAGLLMERVTGDTWEETVKDRIFTPLGMNGSNFSIFDLEESEDFSLPYLEKKGTLEAISFRQVLNMGPAISINSSVKDLAKWVRLHLSDGTLDDKYLISEGSLKEMHMQQVGYPVYPNKNPYLFGYGLGWEVGFYNGFYVVEHGGCVDGFLSSIVLFPMQKVGVIVLINSLSPKSAVFNSYVSYGVADYVLGLKEGNWIEFVESQSEKDAPKEIEEGDNKEEEDKELPSGSFEEYVGEFKHPGYGELQIALAEDSLIARLNGVPYVLEHQKSDLFIGVDETLFARMGCFFERNLRSEIIECYFVVEPSVSPIRFLKQKTCYLPSREDLIKCVGKYQGDLNKKETTVSIFLKKGNLVASIPGFTPYQLIPKEKNEFFAEGCGEDVIRFIMKEDGQVEEILLIQPKGESVFRPLSSKSS